MASSNTMHTAIDNLLFL